jgi:hypothetical protein
MEVIFLLVKLLLSDGLLSINITQVLAANGAIQPVGK